MDMHDPKGIQGQGEIDMTALVPYFRLGLGLTRAQETLLEDFSSGLGNGDCDERLIRPRLYATLMVLLAKVMKETRISRDDDESTCNSDLPSIDYSAPCWMADQKLIVSPVADFASHPVEITMHFILLYGRRPTLDTNLIVLRKQTILPDEDWGVLAAMSAIHRQRKEAGDNGDIYGIHTDTYTWNFFHLNNSGKYSTKLDLSWSLDQKEVIGRICQIIREARALSRKVGGRDSMLGIFESETEENSDDEILSVIFSEVTVAWCNAAHQLVLFHPCSVLHFILHAYAHSLLCLRLYYMFLLVNAYFMLRARLYGNAAFYTIAYCGVVRYWHLAIDGPLNNRIDIQVGHRLSV
ncbi:uncharacterized protein An15g04110 [Aspergillus niger]|uniref:Contig An15c0140, genomic contig n=2 Tax=Aspergillus niger TaxID=5061 RepID=A5AC06_ASPNC|nr:uncharacterized protein An15g04110 [Aspergillus niger]CAK97278.1 unnamed protein product [Aspergillus niger]